mmetsp:Transcript_15703/g.19466  ORF Transcript_15703/g.19466 Transcript_15703/m.19466 type:complete len:190 (-) Transcript_15703:120-689(-)
MIIDAPTVVINEISFDIYTLEENFCSSEKQVNETAPIFFKTLVIQSEWIQVFLSRKIPAEFVEHPFIVFTAPYMAAMTAETFPFQLVNNDNGFDDVLIVVNFAVGTAIVVGTLSLLSVFAALGFISIESTKFYLEKFVFKVKNHSFSFLNIPRLQGLPRKYSCCVVARSTFEAGNAANNRNSNRNSLSI